MILKVPTELNDKQIEEYQRIYKKIHGADISKEEAIKQGLDLIRFFVLVINKSGKQL
jgi:hypothetical protein